MPRGYALSADDVDAVARGDAAAIAALEGVSAELGLMAVRSSALDEDSADASFAGAHLSVLAVSGRDAAIAAVGAVLESGQLPAPRATGPSSVWSSAREWRS